MALKGPTWATRNIKRWNNFYSYSLCHWDSNAKGRQVYSIHTSDAGYVVNGAEAACRDADCLARDACIRRAKEMCQASSERLRPEDPGQNDSSSSILENTSIIQFTGLRLSQEVPGRIFLILTGARVTKDV